MISTQIVSTILKYLKSYEIAYTCELIVKLRRCWKKLHGFQKFFMQNPTELPQLSDHPREVSSPHVGSDLKGSLEENFL